MNTTATVPTEAAPCTNPPGALRDERVWAAAAFLAALGAVVTEDWLSTLAYHQLLERFPWWKGCAGAQALIALVLTCALAWWLACTHERKPRPKDWQVLPQVLLLLFLVLSVNWLSLAGEDWLAGPPAHFQIHPVRLGVASLTALAFFGAVATNLRESLLHPRNLSPKLLKELPPSRHPRVLVMMVSTPSFVPAIATDAAKQGFFVRLTTPADKDGQCVSRSLEGKSLAADIEAIDAYHQAVAEAKLRQPRWNWQQLLRALQIHARLDKIWLVGSPNGPDFIPPEDRFRPGHCCKVSEGQGSAEYLDKFALPLLQRYTSAQVHVWKTAADFEDFNKLVAAIRGLLADSLKGVPPADIFVDVTGGQKPASIAGATLTLNRELRFQYVQTNAPYDTLAYDLMLHGPPSPRGHA